MAAKKKSAGQAAATKAKPATTTRARGPAKKAAKKLTRPAEVLETLKRGAKKAVKKAVRVAKRKIVDTERRIEDRIKSAVARKKKKPAGPSR